MKYIARKRHSKPCDLCEEPIIVGDRVKSWCWTSEDGPGNGTYGGICRVHATCDKIASDESIYDEHLSSFEATDEDQHQNGGEENKTRLVDMAAKSLAEDRATRGPCVDPESLLRSLRNVAAYVRTKSHGTKRTINDVDAGHLLRFCDEVGVSPTGSVLRET